MIPAEGQTVEHKASLGERREIVETCAAFASAPGGRIYIGVRDDGPVAGVQIGRGTLEGLANDIAQNIVPKLVPIITTVQEAGQTVVVVEVAENPTKPVSAYGRAYRRSGRTNQVLAASEIAELYFTSRGVTWDETARADAILDDIDAEKVRKFLSRARSERQWEIDAQTPVEPALRQLNLTKNGQLTIAALLLFGKNPQRFLLQAKMRCARFKGEDEVEFLDLKVIEGDIIQQVEEAMAFVRRNTSMAAKIEGKLERTERWEYPLDAVREAITNAVCHRDYADSGNVVVRVFDDRLEVSNPGGLPAGMTVEDLKQPHESRPRNKLVADAFFLIKYIEQFGTGIQRIINDCREAGVPEPEFESRADTFRAWFRRPFSSDQLLSQLNLSSRQVTALKYAIAHGKLTRPSYETIAGVPRATANRDLAELVERGLLKKKGAARGTWYEFIFSGNEKIRETIISAKLAEEPPVEAKREKKISRNMSRK
jgi:ATP-dependent DNA helicase RecG